jgi:hypothetical protein
MTLVLSINGPQMLWVLADRRLSSGGRVLREDARKVMLLDTVDGCAILSYTGLGATARGTEPADWMSAALRGTNLPLEQSLYYLSEVAKKQIPKHLVQLAVRGGPMHSIVVTAFNNGEPKVFTIDLAFTSDRKRCFFRRVRHVVHLPTDPATPRTPRLFVGGSGEVHLKRHLERWARPLLRLLRACDRGLVKPRTVADHLAKINHEVHAATADNSVGPRCVVVWRPKPGTTHTNGGHQFYTGITADQDTPALPTISQGMDVEAISRIMMPHMMRHFDDAHASGDYSKPPDMTAMNAELSKLPDKPDENLR